MSALTRASLAATAHPELSAVVSKICPSWTISDAELDRFFEIEAEFRLDPPNKEDTFRRMGESIWELDEYLMERFGNYEDDVRRDFGYLTPDKVLKQINHHRKVEIEIEIEYEIVTNRITKLAGEKNYPSRRFTTQNAFPFLFRQLNFSRSEEFNREQVERIGDAVQMYIYDLLDGAHKRDWDTLFKYLDDEAKSRAKYGAVLPSERLQKIHSFLSVIVRVNAAVKAGILDAIRLNRYGLAPEFAAEGAVLERAQADICTIATHILKDDPSSRMQFSYTAFWKPCENEIAEKMGAVEL